MRSFVSAIVLAASFALLVPDNGAQAVNAAQAPASGLAAASSAMPAAGAADREGPSEAPIDSDAAVLLALGFLGAVMARRLRAD